MASGGEVGLDEARMNRRHTNTGMTQIDSETLEVSRQGGLARAICRRLRESPIRSKTRNRDQSSLFALDHLRQHSRHAIHRAEYVDSDHICCMFRCKTGSVIGSADTGIGDEYINRTKLFTETIRSFPDGFCITHISRRSNRFDVLLLRLSDDLVEQILTARKQTEMSTTRRNLQ